MKLPVCACMSVHRQVHSSGDLQTPEEEAGAPGTGATSDCRMPNDSVGPKLSSSARMIACLTTELSLEPSLYYFYVSVEEFSFCYWGLEVVYHWAASSTVEEFWKRHFCGFLVGAPLLLLPPLSSSSSSSSFMIASQSVFSFRKHAALNQTKTLLGYSLVKSSHPRREGGGRSLPHCRAFLWAEAEGILNFAVWYLTVTTTQSPVGIWDPFLPSTLWWSTP